MSANDGKRRRSSITLEGLVHLVRHCPRLSILVLALDASVIPDSDQRPGGGFVNDRITTIWVRDSPLKDPIAVAAFLSDLFPNLTMISTTASDDAGNIDKWKTVENALGTLAMVRQQERNWARDDEA
ncbi:hypothetical protein B0H21DRAFT_886000 [Amylocystis lapponica]|nr:hypothetical protein B0H21DRAFT_886000 [Amylocystis lapponica]